MDDRFETRSPSVRNALDLFAGKWISKIPVYGYGQAVLFEDGRLALFDTAIGGFAGKKVLELGPLDGGHTFMMATLGAAEILAVEANKDSYLRCLVIKEIFNLPARFLLGDFERYLLASPPRVDVILASGVLYHMERPLQLIEAITQSCDTVCCWTHYYNKDVFDKYTYLREKFQKVVDIQFRERSIRIATQLYNEDVTREDFAGGTEPISTWIERQGIIDAFDALGFQTDVLEENVDHPHGSSFTFVAKRRKAAHACPGML